MPYYYVIAICVAAFLVGVMVLLDKVVKSEKIKHYILIGFCALFTIAFVCRYLSDTVAIKKTIGLNIFSPFGINGQTETVFCLFTFWVTVAAIVVLETYPYFKDKIFILKHLVKFFVTTVYVLNLATMNLQIQAMFTSSALDTIHMGSVFFALETGIAIAICAMVWYKEWRTPFNWKGLGLYVLTVIGMMLVSVPCFAFQLLFGKGPGYFIVEDFNFAHRMIIYGAFIVPVIIAILFYNKDYDHKRYALLFMSLAICISYSISYEFRDLINLRSYPFHLCNLAVYLVPLCLIFKIKHIYYFTFFINVFGALMAILLPNLGDDEFLFTYSNVRFWINHYDAFFMPILIMIFKLYDRPKMKELGYSLIGFAGYFALVLFVNAYFTSKTPLNPTDFFFINSDFIASKFGAGAKEIRLIQLKIPTKWGEPMVFYPVYQAIFFTVYVGVTFLMWYVYLVMFQIEDNMADVFGRNRKMKADMILLEESLKGRNKNEPMDEAGANKLILKNFSKKYSTSNVFAVKDANLEIEGGQIFGFLGPNGAGKSTIIKSVVGIQTISSGSIEVCGFDVEKQSVQAKLQIGFVPDHYALYENLSGREYINYIANLYGVDIDERNKRIDEFVERFQLQGSFENPIKTYSHGMKQKITIMSALVHNPKVWILDEPLTGLDPDSIFQVKETMKQHAAAGNIVFFSSHIIDVVEKICDKIAIIKNGHIICTADVKEIEASGVQLENFYRTTIESSTVEREVDTSFIEAKKESIKKIFKFGKKKDVEEAPVEEETQETENSEVETAEEPVEETQSENIETESEQQDKE